MPRSLSLVALGLALALALALAQTVLPALAADSTSALASAIRAALDGSVNANVHAAASPAPAPSPVILIVPHVGGTCAGAAYPPAQGFLIPDNTCTANSGGGWIKGSCKSGSIAMYTDPGCTKTMLKNTFACEDTPNTVSQGKTYACYTTPVAKMQFYSGAACGASAVTSVLTMPIDMCTTVSATQFARLVRGVDASSGATTYAFAQYGTTADCAADTNRIYQYPAAPLGVCVPYMGYSVSYEAWTP